MYRRPVANAPVSPPMNAGTNPELTSSILQAVAAHAQTNGRSQPVSQATDSLTAPMHIITNPASFNNFLKSHKAAVAFFTSETCPPCKMIEPVFERISEEKGLQNGRSGAGFAKIDIDVGMGRTLASEWGIRATPTFMFFLDGKKVNNWCSLHPHILTSLSA
jgi:thiol-disulfide isomerase/thioredoxin